MKKSNDELLKEYFDKSQKKGAWLTTNEINSEICPETTIRRRFKSIANFAAQVIKKHGYITVKEPEVVQDPEQERVLKFLQKGKRSIIDICNYLDKSPVRVLEIVENLKKSHFNVEIYEDQQVDLIAKPQTGQVRSINVEKYFGSSREIIFGVASDLHYASKYCREELIQLQYEIFKKEGVEIVFQPGNMIDGEASFNKYDLLAWGVEGQTQYLIKHAPKIDGITTYFITANHHEYWGPKMIGLNYGQKLEHDMKQAGRNDWIYLSHVEADVSFKTKAGECIVRITHPQGGVSYAISYPSQKAIESYQGGSKPHMLIMGHHHKLLYFHPRSVATFMAGCFQDQTEFMRTRHIEAQLGAWVIRAKLAENGSILQINPKAYPYFDKKIYQVNTDFAPEALELNERREVKPAKVF